MTEQFVPYKPSLRLKAIGFDEPCFGMYCEGRFHLLYPNSYKDIPEDFYREVDAPTFSQAFRWFREKYSIYGMILPSYADSKEVKDRFFYEVANGKKIKQELEYHTTYEEAELACLQKLIEIVESKTE